MITNIVYATITAYCACKTCCGPNAQGITASGKKPNQGVTIAASRTIPLGSKVLVNEHTYVVQDRLAKRFDSRFDIFFDSHQDAKNFGIKKNVKVAVITKK